MPANRRNSGTVRSSLRVICAAILSLSCTSTLAGEIDADAVIGGAVGGGLGAAAGSYLGGREGAILGSAVGAAAGTAIATEGNDHGSDADANRARPEMVYVTKSKSGKKNKGCPPGLKMQGRC